MAMTKLVRVSFDLKMVVPTKGEETMCRQLVELTKGFTDGKKLDGLQVALVKAAVESGLEAALELALKKSIKEEIVEAFDDDQFNASNFRFEVKR